MFHYTDNIVDSLGNALSGWSVKVFDQATGLQVNLYADREGTQPLPNNTAVASAPLALVDFYCIGTRCTLRFYDASGVEQYDLEDIDIGGDLSQIYVDLASTAASAAAAAVSATTATTQATTATTQAGIATTQASLATTQAGLALTAGSTGNPYPNAYASTLPKGVTSVAIGTAGSGGTAGTYALGVSGGPTGFAGTYTISGGGVTAITITNPGLATTTTAPTLSFPSGGVTGAAATATVSTLVPTTGRYWAATSDSKGIALWSNDGTATPAAVLNPDATQVVLYGKAAIDAFVASGLQTDITTAGGPYYERDSDGLVPLQITPDGGVFNVKRYRPGPVTGYNDKIDIHAELDNLATAIKLSTTTAALRNAVRNYGFYPQPAARLAVGDTPTIGTLSTSSGISGTLVSPIDSRIAWASGCPVLYSDVSGNNSYPDNTLYSSRGAYYGRDSGNTKDVRSTFYNAIEFNHTGSALEVFMKAVAVPSGVANIRVLVNDCEAGTAILATNGSLYYLPVTFPGSATRRIRIEVSGSAFGGVKVASSGEITTTGRSYPLVTIMGDSFVESTSGAAGLGNVGAGEAIVLGRGLGFGITVAGVGQTGLLNPGGTNVLGGAKVAFTGTNRLNDLTMAGITNAQTGLAASPSMGIVCGSVNDAGYSYSPYASMEEAIAAASLTIIDAWVAANSGKPLILMGPLYYSGPPNNRPPLDIYRIRDGMARAATMMAAQNVWFVDRLMPHKREGIYSTATDQASLYTLSADGVHPTFAGHAFDGLDDAHRLIKPIVMGMLA